MSNLEAVKAEMLRDELQAAEQKLQSLRADIAYVRGHLEGYASMLGRLGPKANLSALIEALREDSKKLLDQAETAGAE